MTWEAKCKLAYGRRVKTASPRFRKQDDGITTLLLLSVCALLPLNSIGFTQLPLLFVIMASLMT